MKRTLVVAVFALLAVQQASAGPWLKTYDAAQKKAKQKNQLIFVDLFADWCGWCHKMEQEVFPSETFQKATDDMVLLRLNTEDGADGTKFAQKYEVRSLPTFLILNEDGLVAGEIRGYAPAQQFVTTMKERQDAYKIFEKTLADETSYKDDFKKRLDLAMELRERGGHAQAEARFKKMLGEGTIPADVRDQTYYQLAVVQLLQNRTPDAVKTLQAFSKVTQTGEWYERGRLLMAQIYASQGNYLSAVSELRNFKKQFPNSPLVKNADAVLPDFEKQLAAKK